MKEGVRILAIACAPTDKKKTLLIGVVSRKGYIEGILSSAVTVDGTDSADAIAKMLNKSRFREQVRLICLNGLGVAGLNILDVWKLEKLIGSPIISITRKRPQPDELIKALNAFSKEKMVNVDKRLELVENFRSLNIIRASGLYIQTKIKKEEASKFSKDAFELVRLAHLIARGISTGESKGRI